MKFLRISFLSLFVAFLGCTHENQYVYIEGNAFATTYHIVYKDNAKPITKAQIDTVLDAINRSLSVYDSTSTTSLINSNKSKEVDSVFIKAYHICKLVADSSRGAFDITVAPLINSWGFGSKRRQNITSTQIDSLLKLVGYQKVSLSNGLFVKQNPAITVNLSSVGDGLAVDEVVALLEKRGITNYMVEIGGEVKSKGLSAKQITWKIGIDKPIYDSLAVNREMEQIVNLDGEALSTSGSYRKFFIRDGKKFSHFIDPTTGKPVTHNLLSASVIHKNCALADGFSTAFMVMGLEKSLRYLKTDTTLCGYFIYSEGDSLKVAMSDGFERFLK